MAPPIGPAPISGSVFEVLVWRPRLIAIALLAASAPALRASRVQPLEALRHE